ncbi:MAG: CDP-diacylglycerol--glycerol-3-phosphate 3-phosphatidyltransferase [Candidatus Riflemargulisbacteria bacterium]
MTLATKITLSRILAIPLLVILLLSFELPYHNVLSLTFFLIIAFSDFLDGYIARKFNQVSDLGKLLDPLADKILVTTLLLFFTQYGKIEFYWTAIIVFREYAVLGLRSFAALKNVVIKADIFGKIKTVLQFALICFLIMDLPGYNALIILTVIVTTLSGINYFVKNKEVFNG